MTRLAEPTAEPPVAQPENVEQPASKLPRVKLSSFSDKFWTCSGPCTTAGRSYQELYFCQICMETCFCEKCIVLVKGGASGTNSGAGDPSQSNARLPYRHCGPDHTFVQAYPIPDLGKKDMAATIREGYVELHQEWLDTLKAEWTTN